MKLHLPAFLGMACAVPTTTGFSALPPSGKRLTPSHRTSTGLSFTSNTADGDLPRIISTKGVPIHLYTHDIPDDALDQLRRLAESPFPPIMSASCPMFTWARELPLEPSLPARNMSAPMLSVWILGVGTCIYVEYVSVALPCALHRTNALHSVTYCL